MAFRFVQSVDVSKIVPGRNSRLVILLTISFGWVVCLRCVTDTEGHLVPSLNVLFWNQVVEANQFGTLPPFISWFGGRLFFVLRSIHLGSPLISASMPTFRSKAWAKDARYVSN